MNQNNHSPMTPRFEHVAYWISAGWWCSHHALRVLGFILVRSIFFFISVIIATARWHPGSKMSPLTYLCWSYHFRVWQFIRTQNTAERVRYGAAQVPAPDQPDIIYLGESRHYHMFWILCFCRGWPSLRNTDSDITWKLFFGARFAADFISESSISIFFFFLKNNFLFL